MERVNWSDDFLTGISSFDAEHEHLIKLLDQLITASESPSLAEINAALLSELMDTTTSHFKHEEEFMVVNEFPGRVEHTAMHEEFMVKAEELQRLSILVDKPVPIALVIFLRKWLIDHILIEDKKYSTYTDTD